MLTFLTVKNIVYRKFYVRLKVYKTKLAFQNT